MAAPVGPTAAAGLSDPAAAPLARLLLRCTGRAAALAVRVEVPRRAHPAGSPSATAFRVFTVVEKRVRRIVTAAAKAAARLVEAAGEGGRPGGAELPRVECFERCWGDDMWDGWLDCKVRQGEDRAAKRQRLQR